MRALYLGVLFLGVWMISSCSRPIAQFEAKMKKEPAPTTITFENKSKKATSYEWDFGDGTKSTEESPKHMYQLSGNHTVILKAKKGEKESVFTQNVFVEEPLDCLVEMITEYGTVTIKLFNETPLHRDNFLKLVELGYYNDLLFHRVINGFMIQGGDPGSKNAPAGKNLGSGGPGYQIPAEFRDSLVHVKGALAAARTGDAGNPKKKSSGSQFYVVHGRSVTHDELDAIEAQTGKKYTEANRQAYIQKGGTPFLDHGYTVFGMVISGLHIIDKIARTPTNGQNRPKKDVKFKMRVVK